jgi:hypothetical protein
MTTTEWIVSVISAGNGLFAVWLAWKRQSPMTSMLFTVWLIALLAFSLTLPAIPVPPFAAGGQLGLGILIGTGLWLLGACFSAVALLLSLVAPAAAFFLAPLGPLPILYGILISTALVWFYLGQQWRALPALALVQFAFCAALGLVYETTAPAGILPETWRLGPLWVALAGALAFAIGTGLRSQNIPWLGRHLITSGILLGGAVAVSLLSGFKDFWTLTLAALVSSTLVGLVPSARWALLVWIGLFGLVFSTEQGYGTSLIALVVSLYTVVMDEPADLSERGDAALGGATLLTLTALFRLFVEHYPLRDPRADLYTHYTLIGFLLAVVGLVNLLQWWQGEAAPGLVRTVLVGFWAAGAPIALAAIWGTRAAAGWMGGSLALALVTFLLPNVLMGILPLVFCGMATALPLVILVEPLSDAPRADRIGVLLVVGGSLTLSLLVDFIIRRATAQRSDLAPPGPPN